MKAFSIYLTLVFSLFLSFQALFAQKVLTKGEYYFNADPGIGNGVSFGFPSSSQIEENLAISLGNLDPGFHQLHVRLKDSDGRWGITQNRLFYLESLDNSLPNQLQGLEFYIDTDPGVGNGNALSFSANGEFLGEISTSGLASGFHFLYVRYQDNQGNWGIAQRRMFYLNSLDNSQPNQLQALEFYIDTDPGVGNGNASSFSANGDFLGEISTSGLASGFHFLYVRYRDNQGNWGIAHRRMFFLESLTEQTNSELTAMEYFFNEDPGVGNGVSLNLNPEKEYIGAIETTGLNVGFHHLFVRYRDSQGNWGISQNRLFYLERAQSNEPILIQKIEYFFDEDDPGFGLANSLELSEELPEIDLEALIAVAELELGEHILNVRIQDTNGAWSFVESRPFTIEDSQDLTPPVPDLESLPTLSVECAINLEDLAIPTATDYVDGTIQGITNQIFPIALQGNFSIIWTYTDAAGNSVSQEQMVIVNDMTAPVPAVAELPVISDQCSVTVTAPTANDACAGTITGTTADPLVYTVQGSYTVNWIYDDGNGNTSTQTQTVIVDDTTAPVPTLAELPVITDQISVQVTAPNAMDNCKGPIIGSTINPLTYSQEGTYTITWTYDDGNGNISTQNQTVIIDDTTAPVPDIASLPTLTGNCLLEIRDYPTATDNSGETIRGEPDRSPLFTAAGEYTIIWTYDDGRGNISQQTQLIIMQTDTQPFWITEPGALDQTLKCPTQQEIQDSFFAAVPQPGSLCYPVYTQLAGSPVFEPTGTDGSGVYLVTWYYRTPPGIRIDYTVRITVTFGGLPQPLISELPTLTGECEVEVTDIPRATSCSGAELIASTTDPLVYSTQGTYFITWTYDDGNGNTSTQTQTVIVDDTTAPVPTLAELPVITDQISVQVTAPNAMDNCKGPIIGSTINPLTYSQEGTYTITWTYDDGNGNISTQNQTVIIDDTTAPVPDIASLPTLTGNCLLEIRDYPTATDNSGETIRGEPDRSPLFTAAGEYTIIWTYDDGRGNISQQTQLIIMQTDTQPFWITEPGALDQTLKCPTQQEIQDSFFAAVPQPGSLCYPVYTQLAGSPVFEPTGTDGSGVYLVTWYYRTPPGIRIDYTVRITVTFGGLPQPLISELPTLTGECEVEVTDIPRATSCSGAELIASTTDPLVYSTQGTYFITWTYDDGNGNSSTQMQTVVVEDTQAPEILAPENVVIDLNLGETVASGIQLGSPITSDNCGEVIVSNNAPSEFPVGLTEVTWIATDAIGNQSTSIQTVQVNVATCGIQINVQPSVTVDLDQKSLATLKISDFDLGSSSSCGKVTLSLSQTEFTCADLGENEVLFTVTDVNGNVSSATVIVTVSDGIAPVFDKLPKSITISLNEGDPYPIPDFSSFVTDNCGIDSYTQSIAAGTINTTAGIFDVVINAADASGNSVSATVSIERTAPKAKGGKAKRLIPGEHLLISVPWNTSFDEVVADIETEEGILIGWKDEGYDPLTPGLYQITPVMTPKIEFRYKDVMVTVAVEDKQKALDIKLSGTTDLDQPKAGDQIALLSTIDPVDDIHTYRIEGNPNLAIEGNKLFWRGSKIPAAQMKMTVFSTDRAGQTISKEVTLTREILPNEFLLYPNPAGSETNIMVQLNEGATVGVHFFDAAGRLIVNETAFHEETFVKTFNLDGLAPGLYTVQVKIGWLIMTKRLIKQ